MTGILGIDPHSVIVDEVSAALSPKTETTVRTAPQKVIGLRNASGQVGVNPKDKIGASKVDMTLIPGCAKVQMALALMDGASKYGAYNWRVEPIQARTYIAAMMRHLEAFLDGEFAAKDSGIAHLGHVMACCAIVLDAEYSQTLVDDRPIVTNSGYDSARTIETANDWIKRNKPEGWGR